jgi:hypothetical protein
MTSLPLLAPALATALMTQACGQAPPAAAQAPAMRAAPAAAGPHFVDMTANPTVFIRDPKDVDAATIRLDLEAIAALPVEIDDLVEVIVSYDMDHKTAWRAEHDLDPRLEAILAARGAHGRLLATRTTAWQRDYWFATTDFPALASTLHAIPQPDGAAIAVLREPTERINDLKPTAEELAAARRGAGH